MSRITIVSLGSGGPEFLNALTIRALKEASPLMLRTGRHPLCDWLRAEGLSWQSFDDLYDQSSDFDLLYDSIARRLWEAADAPNLVYAVPDPLSDRSVAALYRLRPVASDEIALIPGTGTLDLALGACRGMMQDFDFRAASAASLLSVDIDPSLPLLITELDGEILAGEVKGFLNAFYGDEEEILFFPSLHAAPIVLPLWQLDRQRAYDHRTMVFIPGREAQNRSRHTMRDLEEKTDRLLEALSRSPASETAGDRLNTGFVRNSLRQEQSQNRQPDRMAGVNRPSTDDEEALAQELSDLLLRACRAKARGDFDLRDIMDAAFRLLKEE